jgi:4-amino-4-deoxy-L-arabinose transferase-like glycosyltransferase
MNAHQEANSLSMRDLRWAILVAVLARAAWSLVIPVMPLSDSAAYDAFARTLSAHGVFGWTPDHPFSFWPPGTTFLHGGIYWLFGPDYRPIVAANILISVGLMWTSARIAGRLLSTRAGILCAWIIALWPTLIFYVTVLASEILFAFLITAAFDVWSSGNRRTLVRGAFAGALLGAAALVRPLALLLPFVYAVSLALSATDWRNELKSQAKIAVAAVIALAAVVAPWTLRNNALYGKPVLVSTNGGITFWMGNTPGTDGSYAPIPHELSHLPGIEQERILSARAWDYIESEPAAFVSRTALKVIKLYSNESIGVTWNSLGIGASFGENAIEPLKRFTQISWAVLFFFALVGIWSLFRDRGWWYAAVSPPVMVIAYFTAIHAVTVSQDRYHLSFASFLAVLMAAGICVFFQHYSKRMRRS